MLFSSLGFPGSTPTDLKASLDHASQWPTPLSAHSAAKQNKYASSRSLQKSCRT